MFCRDSEMATLLPFYAAGTLTAEERTRVEAHLAVCAACQSELPILTAGAKLLEEYGTDLIHEHIRAEQLVEYSHDRAQLNAHAVKHIEFHLRVCSLCAQSAGLLADMNQDLATTFAGPPVKTWVTSLRDRWLTDARRTLWKPAFTVATALLVITGALTAYFTYYQSPPSATMNVQHFILTMDSMARGGQERVKPNLIELKPGHSSFVINFSFPILVRSDLRYDLEITDAQERIIYKRQGIKSQDAYGYFEERFERKLFTAGSYVMTVNEVQTADGAVTQTGRFPFQVAALK